MGRPQVIQAFEVSPYSDGTFILKNSRSAAYAIISEYQAFLMEVLERESKVSSVLFPSNGIATVKHFEQAVELLTQLQRLEIIEWDSEVAPRLEKSGVAKADGISLRPKKSSGFLQPLAEVILEIGAQLFCKTSTWLQFASTIAAAVGAILFFPDVGRSLRIENAGGMAKHLLVLYVTATLAINLRTILRAGFLKRSGRQAFHRRFRWLGPFLSLDLDERDLWMSGYGARLRFALLGLFAPAWLAIVALAAFHAGVFSLELTYSVCVAAFGVILLLLFPLLGEDGEELLHLLFFGRQLETSLASESLEALQPSRGHYSVRRRVIWTYFATVLWTLLWLDSARAAFRPFLQPLVVLRHEAPFGPEWLMGNLLIFVYAAVLQTPLLFLIAAAWSALSRWKSALLVQGSLCSIEAGVEEKLASLKRIPLFAFLSDEDRANLLSAMESQSYEAGEYLVQQGSPGSELYVLLKGEAQAVFRDATGRIHNVGGLRPGDAFGEIALLDSVPRTASILAKERCLALKLNKAVFEAQILRKTSNIDRIKQMVRLSSFFKRHPLLSRLPAQDQAQIIESFRYRSVVANDEVLEPQTEDDPKFCLVYSGKFILVGERDEEVLLSSEDCFGYLLPGQNPAYLPKAKVKEAGGLLTLSQKEFRALIFDRIDQSPEILQC